MDRAEHIAKWTACQRCPFGKFAYRRVIFEVIPDTADKMDVLIIGGSPGRAEDYFGEPFIGPSGAFLRGVVADADMRGIRVGMTNLVACRPAESIAGNTLELWPYDKKLHGLSKEVPEPIIQCNPRLRELIGMFEPKIIIGLGREAAKILPSTIKIAGHGCRLITAQHPAALLRDGGRHSALFPEFRDKFEDAFAAARQLRHDEEEDIMYGESSK